MLTYLIVCPMVFIAGFIDAIAGGGGLVSLPTYMITGLPVHNCIATNKMSSFMGTSIATYKYAKSGFIPWKLGFICIPCAFIGSASGANLALMVDDGIFKIIMLIVLPATGAYVLLKKDLVSDKPAYSFKAMVIISMIISLAIGVYDGFYGPGTGTFLILLLTGIARMKLDQANGLTKIINWATNLSGLAVYLINGQVLLPLGLTAGLFNIAGNYLGARNFEKSGSKIEKPAMIAVLVIFFIKTLYEMLAG